MRGWVELVVLLLLQLIGVSAVELQIVRGTHLGHGQERDERPVRVGERGVDLVGHHERAVVLGQLGQRRQFRGGAHEPGRVVRCAQQHDAHPGGERGGDPVQVERTGRVEFFSPAPVSPMRGNTLRGGPS